MVHPVVLPCPDISRNIRFPLPHSHVLDGQVLEYLAVVDVPHSLVVPHLAGEQDGAEGDPLPTAGRDVHLGVLEQPLEVHEGDDGALRGQLGGNSIALKSFW